MSCNASTSKPEQCSAGERCSEKDPQLDSTVDACEMCLCMSEHIRATARCEDCSMNLCPHCKLKHEEISFLKDHRLSFLDKPDEKPMIIDNTEFCTVHEDQPIQFYCRHCLASICSTCKASFHEFHNIVTIEKALEELISQLEKYFDTLNDSNTYLSDTLQNVDNIVNEVKHKNEECSKDLHILLDEKIFKLHDEHEKLISSLTTNESSEIEKLREKREQVSKKLEMNEDVMKDVENSVNTMRNATLLTLLIEGGLMQKINALCNQRRIITGIQIERPVLDKSSDCCGILSETDPKPPPITYKTDCIEFKLSESIPSHKHRIVSPYRRSVLSAKKPKAVAPYYECNIDNLKLGTLASHYASRKWPVIFETYLNQPFEKVIDIQRPDQITRICMINNYLWAPMYNDNINIYSRMGLLRRTIRIPHPISVTQACNGDILACCRDGHGVYLIDKEDVINQLIIGSFCDIYSFRNKVYALEYTRKAIYVFSLMAEMDMEDLPNRWKHDQIIFLKEYKSHYFYDTFIATNNQLENNKVQFYVMSRCIKTLYLFNDKGMRMNIFKNSLNNPWLCGIDQRGNILVCDEKNKVLKILNTVTQEWTGISYATKMQSEEDYVHDMVLDNEGTVWQVGSKIRQYVGKK